MWGVRVLLATAPAGRIPRGQEITVDWRVLGAAFGVSLVAGLVCGIFPALASTRRDPREALATSGRTVAGSHDRLRRVFVVAQLALAIVLLTGAGLLLKSFTRMRAVDPGFRASGVVTFDVSLSPAAFPNAGGHSRVRRERGRSLAASPGRRVGDDGELDSARAGGLVHGDLHIEGVSTVPKGYGVDKLVIAPGYFSTMGIRLFAGRDFDSRDNQSSLPVTIVSRSVARTVLAARRTRRDWSAPHERRRQSEPATGDDRRHRRRYRAAGRDGRARRRTVLSVGAD